MMLRQIAALVSKDLRIFFVDRQAIILSFAAPIALASFMASIFGGGGPTVQSKIPILLVDEDRGEASGAIVTGAGRETRLDAKPSSRESAMMTLRQGKVALVVVIPREFGEAASEALIGQGTPPELLYLEDPTRHPEANLAEGLLTRVIFEAISASPLSVGDDRPLDDLSGSLGSVDPGSKPDESPGDRAEFLALFDRPDSPGEKPDRARGRAELIEAFPGLDRWFSPVTRAESQPKTRPVEPSSVLTTPFATRSESIVEGGPEGERGALAAHAFAGMIVQFVLFSAVEWGVGLLVERERGLWKRIRVAPVSRRTLLAAKVLGSMVAALLIVGVVFGFGAMAFGIRVRGSFAGLVLVSVAFAWMAACFGLMVAALGRAPRSARSISLLAVLAMVMLGGGWIPSFLFPAWLQALTPAIPTRWAIDGFDGVISRGFSLLEAGPMAVGSIGFGILFGGVALASFRWAEPT